MREVERQIEGGREGGREKGRERGRGREGENAILSFHFLGKKPTYVVGALTM